MAMQRALFDRLRDPDPPGERHSRVATRDVLASVLTNLQAMLNTCQGNCLTDPNYGLPHLTTIRNSMPGTLKGYESAIRMTIERHEPRLSGVRVRHAPSSQNQMDLRFEISGVIQDEQGRESVRFETFADDNGRLQVR